MTTLTSPYSSDYVTPPGKPGWFNRSFPAARFYLGIANIVFRAGSKAKHGRYDDGDWIKSSEATIRLTESIGARFTIENMAAIANLEGPAVILGNHMSTLETFALPCMIRPHGPVTFVVKKQLVEMPVFKHTMKSRNPIVLGRSNPREDLKTVLTEGEARLRDGMSVIVFPQKTRGPNWIPGEFNSIGIKMAKRAGVPVVPLALRTDVWGTGKRIRDMGPINPSLPVHFAFGDPIEVVDNGREAQEAVVNFITEKVRGWGVPVIEGNAATD